MRCAAVARWLTATIGRRARAWQSLEAQAYAIIYLVIFFILILNFVLAIIVDAYMNVRQKVALAGKPGALSLSPLDTGAIFRH